MTAVDVPFSLADPLPEGPLAIQASAGTGKTFTLAALTACLVAERGVSAGELLVVTFTRAATSELRDRVRQRLIGAASHLASDAGPSTDPLLLRLEDCDPEERGRRAERLASAVTEFDAATITTIHGFASQVLGTLGAASGVDPDRTVVEDDADIAPVICADALASAAVEGHPVDQLPTFNRLVAITRLALASPGLVLLPEETQEGATPAHHLLRSLVVRSVERIAEHRHLAGTRSFSDLLADLRQALAGPGGPAAAAALRGRFRVALIDEFQDTDPVQWEIFASLFLGEGAPPTGPGASTALVFVGDPKQAIYAFRGANIHTYLDAVGRVGSHRVLDTNWRSDAPVLEAVDALLAGTTYGSEGIAFSPVLAAPGHEEARLGARRGPAFPALSIRLTVDPSLERKGKYVQAGAARDAIYADLVAQVRALLVRGTLPARDDGDDPARTRSVRPSDIAVLVKSNDEAAAIQRELLAQGVPAVLARGTSVLASPAATHWRWLLEAVAHPSDPGRARTYALSWFEGRTPGWVDAASDAELAGLQDRLHHWADTLVAHGVPALLRRVWSETGVAVRVLARPDGDRAITDLEHVAELLRTETNGRATSAAGLVTVLQTDPEIDPITEMVGDKASRRVESDAEAVQLLTVWVSKGLEFPITCCPTLWSTRADGSVLFQDPDRHERVCDVTNGAPWPDKKEAKRRKALSVAEQDGENLRLLYVALTRARHHTILWWAPVKNCERAGVTRVLFARDPSGAIDLSSYLAPTVALPPDDEAIDRLRPLVDAAAGTIRVEAHGLTASPPLPWAAGAPEPSGPTPTTALLDRVPDRSRRRWSFTGISARAEDAHQGPGSSPVEPEPEIEIDEPSPDDHLDDPDGPGDALAAERVDPSSADRHTPGSALASPLASLPAGASFGTLVHGLFEHIDFTAQDLDAVVAAELDRQLAWRQVDLRPVRPVAGPGPDSDPPGVGPAPAAGHDDGHDGRALLVAGVRAAIETPLGPLLHGRRLRDIPAGDRLDELGFDLRLGEAGRTPTDRHLGEVVLRHLLPTDPYRAWATDLATGRFGVDLAGHLTGEIDAVLRVTPDGGPVRFVVVDYKTNRLHERGRPPRAGDYGPLQVAASMIDHHYPLQALLYLVALHRYLRWRQPGYDPAIHLGGAAYLFVRGMIGAQVAVTDGVPHGVASWPVPPALVVELSAVLDGQEVGP